MTEAQDMGLSMPGTIRNILRGAGTVLSVMPEPYTIVIAPSIAGKSDFEAIYSDWRLIGEDLQAALNCTLGDDNARETRMGDKRMCHNEDAAGEDDESSST